MCGGDNPTVMMVYNENAAHCHGISVSPRHSRVRGNPLLLTYIRIQVPPFGIFLFYHLDFPRSSPFLELFFPFDSILTIFMDFVIDELFNIIFLCKTFNKTILMLPYSSDDIRSYAQIERTVSLTCHYVDIEWFFYHHSDPRSGRGQG